MSRVFPWSLLGIDADADERAIRRAYATKLKAMDPDSDPAGFERLRSARDRALALARSRAAGETVDEEAWDDWNDAPVRTEWDGDEPAGPTSGNVGLADGDGAGDVPSPPPPIDGYPVDLGPKTLPSLIAPSIAAGATDDAISAPPSQETPLPRATGDLAIAPGHPTPVDLRFTLSAPQLDRPWHQVGTVTPQLLALTVDGRLEQSQDALYRLLIEADPNVALSIDEESAIGRHLDVVLAAQAEMEIGRAADLELWLAEIFARSTPRSHPFAQRLADHFNWRAEAGNLNQPRSIAWLTDRALAFDFRDRVTQPTNKGYKAWIELTTPAMEGTKRGRVKYVRELLDTVRSKHPILESEFDWHRVALWERAPAASSGGGGSNWWVVILPILFILSAIGRIGDSDRRYDNDQIDREQAAAVDLAEFDDEALRRVTIDDALRSVGGEALTIEIVEARKPLIIEELDRQLVAGKSRFRALRNTEGALVRSLNQRLRGGLATAPWRQLRDYRAAQGAMLLRLKERNPARCLDFYSGESPGVGMDVADLLDPLQRAQAAIILSTDRVEATAEGSRQFSASTRILDLAAERAGMSRDRLLAVIAGTGSETEKCTALGSLIATAAAGPREETEETLRQL